MFKFISSIRKFSQSERCLLNAIIEMYVLYKFIANKVQIPGKPETTDYLFSQDYCTAGIPCALLFKIFLKLYSLNFARWQHHVKDRADKLGCQCSVNSHTYLIAVIGTITVATARLPVSAYFCNTCQVFWGEGSAVCQHKDTGASPDKNCHRHQRVCCFRCCRMEQLTPWTSNAVLLSTDFCAKTK